jgi:hypothetical protein
MRCGVGAVGLVTLLLGGRAVMPLEFIVLALLVYAPVVAVISWMAWDQFKNL